MRITVVRAGRLRFQSRGAVSNITINALLTRTRALHNSRPVAQTADDAVQFNQAHVAVAHRHVEAALSQVSDFRIPSHFRQAWVSGRLRVVKWHVEVGDDVVPGLPICDLSDGVTIYPIEFFAPLNIQRARVTHLLVPPNSIIPPPPPFTNAPRDSIPTPALISFIPAEVASRERSARDRESVEIAYRNNLFITRATAVLCGVALAIAAYLAVTARGAEANDDDPNSEANEAARYEQPRPGTVELPVRALPVLSDRSQELLSKYGRLVRTPSACSVVSPLQHLLARSSSGGSYARAGASDFLPWLKELGVEVILWSALPARLTMRLVEPLSPSQRDFDYIMHADSEHWTKLRLRYSTETVNRNPKYTLFLAPEKEALIKDLYDSTDVASRATLSTNTVLVPPYTSDVIKDGERVVDPVMRSDQCV